MSLPLPKSAACARIDCKNGASWQPVILLYAAGHKNNPCDVVMGLWICDTHKNESNLGDYLDDKLWDRCVKILRATCKKDPCRPLTKLSWKPFG